MSVPHFKFLTRFNFFAATFIRGMTVDEALKELKFIDKKGARVVEEVLIEAREMALQDHHFEYPTNMWIAESTSEMFKIYKNLRRHRGLKMGTVKHRYVEK